MAEFEVGRRGMVQPSQQDVALYENGFSGEGIGYERFENLIFAPFWLASRFVSPALDCRDYTGGRRSLTP